MSGILQEGQNCWKIAPATKVKFLVDGESYFGVLARALELARESILIVGWDFDSRVRLTFDSESSSAPKTIGELLNDLAARRRDLQVHILVWDFAMIFALERSRATRPSFSIASRTSGTTIIGALIEPSAGSFASDTTSTPAPFATATLA